MINRIICLLALISVMNVACARSIQPKTPQQRAAHKTRVLTRELNLTSTQAVQVKSIMLLQATRIDSLKSEFKNNKRANRMARRQIRQQTSQRMSSILTAEQQASYASWKLHKKEKRNAEKQAS